MRIRTVASLVVVGIALAGVLCATGCGSGTPSPAVTVTVTPSSQGTVKHYASSKYGFSLTTRQTRRSAPIPGCCRSC